MKECAEALKDVFMAEKYFHENDKRKKTDNTKNKIRNHAQDKRGLYMQRFVQL